MQFYLSLVLCAVLVSLTVSFTFVRPSLTRHSLVITKPSTFTSLSLTQLYFTPLNKPEIQDGSGRIDAVASVDEQEEAERKEKELVQRINAEVLALTGVELEQLINPSKVVNLERDLLNLQIDLEKASSEKEKNEIEKKMSSKQKTLFIEKRSVMRGWLKNLFVIQSVLAAIFSLAMVYNCVPGYSLPLSVQVLGFWMWWLFIIPSLRARKPAAQEKNALNIAFLMTPAVSLILPVVTRDVIILWWANFATTALCYVYGFTRPAIEEERVGSNDSDDSDNNSVSRLLKQAFRALDYGSGQERGLRK